MKPKRETIGRCRCPFCGCDVDVRENAKHRLYLMCDTTRERDGCGLIYPNLPAGQKWIRANMKPLNAPEPAPAAAPVVARETQPAPAAPKPAPAPAPQPAPAATTTPPPKKSGGAWTLLG